MFICYTTRRKVDLRYLRGKHAHTIKDAAQTGAQKRCFLFLFKNVQTKSLLGKELRC